MQQLFQHHFCVTLYLFNQDGRKTLLIKHKKLNWFLPVGGHIEAQEDYLKALSRECEEELGIKDFVLPNYLHPYKFGTTQPIVIQRNHIKTDHIHDDLIFAGIVDENTIIKPQNGESQDYKWFNCNEIESIYTSPEVIQHVNNISKIIYSNTN